MKRKRDSSDDAMPSDPDALERWRKLPQNAPSKQALPPATGGTQLWGRWLWLLVIIGLLIAVSLLLRALA
ncbi:MAG: hypothetical protein CUN54_04010 [Phototrophicales bacterium]|nr:MAG: hypothetical protein CUN54_04010 [Phototrophicales bacterium]